MDETHFEKALEMPLNERLTFAALILASMDYEEDEIRQLWINEVNDRMKAVKEGKARLLNFEDLYNRKK